MSGIKVRNRKPAPSPNQPPTEKQIYCDGSAPQNPGGAIAYAVVNGQCEALVIEALPPHLTNTNNRAEVLGLTAALALVPEGDEAAEYTIYCDSEYALKIVSEWLPGWRAKLARGGKQRKNWDVIVPLDEIYQSRRLVNLRWIKGNSSSPAHVLADALAGQAARAAQAEHDLVASGTQADGEPT